PRPNIPPTAPLTATTNKISVTTLAGTSTSVASYTVILPPTISGFSPSAGPVGSQTTGSRSHVPHVPPPPAPPAAHLPRRTPPGLPPGPARRPAGDDPPRLGDPAQADRARGRAVVPDDLAHQRRPPRDQRLPLRSRAHA